MKSTRPPDSANTTTMRARKNINFETDIKADLEKMKNKINQANFNWLHLSVWLGLRPKEVDLLRQKEFWRVENLPTGRKILWVFQTKIIAVPHADRWKPIPILFEEQHFALRIIEAGSFKRPLVKTIRSYLDKRVDLYGGRIGFSDLMLSKGQTLENISIWMGHSTIQRTWSNYKNKQRFHVAGY